MVLSNLSGVTEKAAEIAATAAGLPEPLAAVFAASAGSVVGAYLQRRHQMVLEELGREMSKGRPWAIADDRAAAMALQINRAYQEGVAKLNVRLMAQFMFAEAAEPSLTGAVHRRNAEHLASLSLEEMVMCAKFVALERLYKPLPATASNEEIQADKTARARDFKSEIVPLFKSEDAAEGHGNSLLRTGWLRTLADWGGGFAYMPTPAFQPVARMVEFEAVALEAASYGVE
ncbi:hypothetical protein GVN21_19560 [Caulobacter sp. SLTY]|uniref:hypothetical protein n=1 Tax=Caulobacter sp. SLTY TaxID=2683262 RepID=UPI0014134349|nr:hypothetical protein [Caulobacter sp. SLTY]NBB17565.1 hypothetical protein [Caulobacter sp. SLTY]